MSLDLSSLEKAVTALGDVTARSLDEALMGSLDDVTRCAIRAGVVQHFEFTYELSWKFIQRWLKVNQPEGDPGLPRTRKELFRLAARVGLIDDPTPWFTFGDARNLTSHTYDEERARQVYEVALDFLAEARDLLARLTARND
jgi:nucleotidyltransferase substrate binding protein (TIGR01987 family)